MGDLGSLPGLGGSPGEEKSYPLQYSGLENSMDCIVHVAAESDTTEPPSLSFTTCARAHTHTHTLATTQGDGLVNLIVASFHNECIYQNIKRCNFDVYKFYMSKNSSEHNKESMRA